MKTEQIKQILADAPEGATHYHENFKKYFKFKECEWKAKIFINKKWERYPLYPSLRSLSDLREILTLREVANTLLSLHDNEVFTADAWNETFDKLRKELNND